MASSTFEMSMSDGSNNYFVMDGVAIIPIYGALMKNAGYPDQTELRALIARAESDNKVDGVLLVIDSPGGTVAGTEDLSNAISAMKKPCIAYIEDLGASAAYWIAASCDKIFSNRAIVGSIGVITELVDGSEYYKNAGIKVHQIVTGEFKGIGDESQPATPEKLDYLQKQIDAIGEVFFSHVAATRGLSKKAVKEMQARVYHGEEAVAAGLVDKMGTIDDAMGALRKETAKISGARRAKAMELVDSMA